MNLNLTIYQIQAHSLRLNIQIETERLCEQQQKSTTEKDVEDVEE